MPLWPFRYLASLLLGREHRCCEGIRPIFHTRPGSGVRVCGLGDQWSSYPYNSQSFRTAPTAASQLDEMLPRLAHVALRTPPMPHRLLKLVEPYA